ncbi:MAG: hypothetical protein M3Y12_15465 [Bacteroidota bacterium]|nr:hypothetical protein [Bacteroidota bacterium]
MRCTFWLLLPELLFGAVGAWGQPASPAAVPAPRFDHDTRPSPRHWRGTIGAQAVTMELDSGFRFTFGSYYYGRRGRPLRLSQHEPARYQGQTRFDEIFTDESGLDNRTGYFLFAGPLRAHLTGTWHSADGRRTLPVALRETYADALAYDEETWAVKRFTRDDFYDSTRLDSAELRQCYLQFRRPLAAATRPIQTALGRPMPPPSINHYLDSLLRARRTDQPEYFFYGETYVAYNSNYLFSVVQLERFTATEDAGINMHEWGQSRTYDLRTGRRLQLSSLLTPSYQVPLRRLLLQRLKLVWAGNAYYDGVGGKGQLPAGGFLVTGTGLTFSYDDRDDDSLGSPGPYHADRSIDIEISYETLLPIIRPNSPLTALLQERHLLPRN